MCVLEGSPHETWNMHWAAPCDKVLGFGLPYPVLGQLSGVGAMNSSWSGSGLGFDICTSPCLAVAVGRPSSITVPNWSQHPQLSSALPLYVTKAWELFVLL